jgi:hypothetical protein
MSLLTALSSTSFDGGGLVGVSGITYVGIYLGGIEGAIPLSWLKLITTYSCEVGPLSTKLSSSSSWSSCLAFVFFLILKDELERIASLETRAGFTANLSDWASPTNLSSLLSIMPFLEPYLDDLAEPLPFLAEFEFDFGGAL